MAKKSNKDLSLSGSDPTGVPGYTLIDVARVAGVSPITVSRALHRPELVSERTRDKVREAARAMGYVPNMLAGGLATNKSRLVAIFLPTIANSIFADTVQAVMDRLTAAGYQTLIGLTGYSAEQEEALLEAVLGRRPDGIVLTGTLHTEASRQRLASARIPVVEAWDLSEAPIDMLVGFSHEQVGVCIARNLLDKGYRRFAVVTLDDPRGLRRVASLKAELQAHGIIDTPTEILPAPATLASGRLGLQGMLEKGHSPQVVVCSSDTIAQGVLAEAASRGLRVPEDLAVMGFGDLSSAAHVHPPLSTVRVNGTMIGQQVAEALLARLRAAPGVKAPPVCIDTGFTIIDRSSTGHMGAK